MRVRFRALLLTLCLLCAFCAPAFAATPPASEEMRGTWVSSVYNLDHPRAPTSDAAALRAAADSILDNVQRMGLNTVFLQVRPSSDALYPSAIFPWSQYLTGTQGAAPTDGFDPLRYWIDGAHARGLELHAWLNPYRVTKGKDAEWKSLAASNPAKLHPEWVVKYKDGNYYYDPGLPAVRALVVNGVREILTNYPDVDGIHLDDYFYPGADFNDNKTFAQYGAGAALDDWRRENVNTLVRELNAAVHEKNPALPFGISPAGVWANKRDNPRGSDTKGGAPSYSRGYADTLAWIAEGSVDYICPQLYWYIGQSAADYAVLTRWWSDAVRGSDVKLYIGEAAYKCSDPKQGEVWKGSAELVRHLKLCETMPAVDGHIFFRYGSFVEVPGLGDAVKTYYDEKTPKTAEEHAKTAAQTASYLQTFMLFMQSILR